LHYLGFFPELDPVNVRINSYNGQDTRKWLISNHQLVNHQFDANGNLIQYDVIWDTFSEQSFSGTPTISWQCK
jgi:hypothetical protein